MWLAWVWNRMRRQKKPFRLMCLAPWQGWIQVDCDVYCHHLMARAMKRAKEHPGTLYQILDQRNQVIEQYNVRDNDDLNTDS